MEYLSGKKGDHMLKHGILGLLNYGEMTGYEIRETFQNSLNYFWTAQTSQIYRELAVLEEKQWIVRRTVTQSGKPNKNICSITDAGRQELRRWLSEPCADMPTRSPILMRLFFMRELPTSDALAYLKSLRDAHADGEQVLSRTDDAIARYGRQVSDPHNALFWQMTADFGKRYAQMCLQWLDDCIELLENTEEPT